MTKRIIRDVSIEGKISRKKINSVVRAVHVVPENEGWQVRKAGKFRVAEKFPSQDAALEYARNISRSKDVDLIIHSKDGRQISIQAKNGQAK
ncbi:MAG: DUF2188 domain-containing protein [Acidobacteria bacterium]|jgi:hypothetical protein|nr:DUF2188 domain-containing protein [Acidobacteriota bacterium]MBA4123543.1 DUF2188 domain-containing protein [Acidobacteriota bacterium]